MPFFKRNPSVKEQPKSEDRLSPSLTENLERIKQKTGKSPDVTIRPFKISDTSTINGAIIFVGGLVEEQSINDFIIESILHRNFPDHLTQQQVYQIISEQVVALSSLKFTSEWSVLFNSLMSGDSIILIDGVAETLIASTKGGERRSIQEPASQVVIRGPHEGFTESISTNIAMVRRIIKSPDLWVETMNIGKVTKTDVSMMYVNGIAKNEVIDEVRNRLQKIEIDSILESGYIEQLIEDQSLTTFPTMYHTERPDSVAGNLLEGRVAIFVDGTPFVLVAPVVFMQFFQSVEDYYTRFDIATSTRFLRILIFLISLIAPAVFISASTFHQEMIPTQLLVVIAAQRETVPFPAVIEALMMEVAFEILREAGIRLPKAVGSAVSIVGALVIGQAAVQAGIVSPAMVIVVAITAVANFATPTFAIAISARLIRFVFILAAALFGFYGVIIGIIMMIVHLCSLRSFGMPYMSPIAPFIPANAGDTIFRAPIWAFWKSPRLITQGNVDREGQNQKPQPDDTRGMKNSNVTKGDQNET